MKFREVLADIVVIVATGIPLLCRRVVCRRDVMCWLHSLRRHQRPSEMTYELFLPEVVLASISRQRNRRINAATDAPAVTDKPHLLLFLDARRSIVTSGEKYSQ